MIALALLRHCYRIQKNGSSKRLELLGAIEAPAPTPEVVEPVTPIKVMEVLDEADEPVIVREDTGAVVEQTAATEPVE